MAEPILQLKNLSKTFIIGKSKNARKALKALQQLQKRYETAFARGERAKAEQLWAQLKRAQDLFSDEQYSESHVVTAGKRLKTRRDKGLVVHALRGIDLEIMPGELVAIMGPSGSGKSTMLNMLGLLDQPTGGQIFMQGRNVTAIKPRELPAIRSKELGFVFQAFNLIPTLTALENVMLPLRYAGVSRRSRKRRAQQALELVGLADRLHHTPGELSGGQQQRVAIARSIVNKPSVIFGDELTGELDTKMTGEIMDLIAKLNAAGQTFVIVTHNPEVAERCKRILYMRDGKIERDEVRQGKPAPARNTQPRSALPRPVHRPMVQ